MACVVAVAAVEAPAVAAVEAPAVSSVMACSLSIAGAVELSLRALALPRRLRLLSAVAVDAESRAQSARRVAETVTRGILEAVDRPERLRVRFASQPEKDPNS